MEITEKSLENGVLVTLAGRLDPITSPNLETHFKQLIGDGWRVILVDCSELVFVSSVGLRTFLIAAKLLRPHGGKMVLAAMRPQVKHVFELAGFASIFAIYPSVGDAAQAVGVALA